MGGVTHNEKIGIDYFKQGRWTVYIYFGIQLQVIMYQSL